MIKKAFVFYFDDTLATTKANVRIYNSDGIFVESVAPSELSSFVLPDKHYMDFVEFHDNSFIENADPTFLIHLAVEVSNERHDVFILTAREDDSSDAIDAFLLNHDIDAKTIHCVGGKDKPIAEKKAEILNTIIQMYDKTYFYDDSQTNIETAPEGENFRKYKVSC